VNESIFDRHIPFSKSVREKKRARLNKFGLPVRKTDNNRLLVSL
jgi:hypothetical protein